MFYFEENELSNIKIDLSFTEREYELNHSYNVVSYINKSLCDYPGIKSIIIIMKRYFKLMQMNSSFTGGLSSYALYLLIYAFFKYYSSKKLKTEYSVSKILFYFLEKFSFFDWKNYVVDVENKNFFCPLKDRNININNKNIQKDEINIIDPLTGLNVAKSSFKVEKIKITFNKAFDLFRIEGWNYDCSHLIKNNFSYNKIINTSNISDNNEFSDFNTIKKLFYLRNFKSYPDFLSI